MELNEGSMSETMTAVQNDLANGIVKTLNERGEFARQLVDDITTKASDLKETDPVKAERVATFALGIMVGVAAMQRGPLGALELIDQFAAQAPVAPEAE